MSQSCPYGDGQYNLTSNSFLIVCGNIWIFDLTSSYTTSPIPAEKCLFLCGSEALCLHVRLDVLEVIFSSTGVI